MALTLTEVSVQVHADMRRLKPEVIKGADEAGRTAGDHLGDGMAEGAAKRLENDKGRFGKAGEGSAAKFSKGFEGGIGGTFAKTAAVMASKFALIGGAAAAAAPGVLQLTAALLPAAGAALALPAGLLAIKGAAAIVTIAVGAAGEAISAGFGDNPKKAAKELDKLSGVTREFAKQVIALRPAVDGLKQQIGDRFLKPLVDDIKPLAQLYVPLLQKRVGDLAGPLGGLGEELAQTARKGDVFKAVDDLFVGTRLSVINLRGAIQPLVLAFAGLLQSTIPELPKLASGFTDLSKKAAAFISDAVDSGAVLNAFEAGKKTLADLGGILKNVGSIVISVFQAVNQNGNTLLANFRDLTKQVADFFNSAKGAGALTSVFSTLGSVGQALRTGLGAVLPALAEAIQAIGPALAGLAGPASQLVVAIAPLLPIVAGLAAQVITALTPAIAGLAKYLSQNEGAVKTLVVVLTAYVAITKTMAIVSGIQAAGGLLAMLKATQVVTVATKLFTAAQFLLGAAIKFALGPIGLIITGLTLLVAGIIYAYKNHEGFRNLVQAVWKAIQQAVKATVDWIVNTAWPWLQKAWQAIADGAVAMWEKGIKPAVDAIVNFFKNVLAPAAMWLWHSVIEPVFKGISWAVKTYMAVVELAIAIVVAYFKNVVAPVAMWLWKNVIQPVFKGIATTVQTSINTVKTVLAVIVAYFRNVVAPAYTWLWKNVVVPVFNGIKNTISNTWNNSIKPVLALVGSFIRNTVAPAFRTGVNAIAKAWEGLKNAAMTPVRFVVNSVINPLIGGFNKVAGVFGTSKISPIPGFAEGGKIPGNSGGRDDKLAQLVGKGGKMLGSIKVASGEFIVNARDTAKALPLLRWINSGMKGGPMNAAKRIGKPLAERPGDGSEGWAFKDGGLVGFLGDIWGAISDPKKAIVAPIEAALGNIPGGGEIRSLLMGMGKKLADGFVSWIGKASGGEGTLAAGGSLGRAMSFVRAQNGKPYVWASAGPGGYDCSGIVSAAYNILHGRSPYNHTFSTGSLPGSYFPKNGPGGLLTAGWAHPGQRGASASVGHMAGQFINGMSFESTGSRGVHINSGRKPSDFAHVGHYSAGGLAGLRIAQQVAADTGRVTLRPGNNLVYNGLGRDEHLEENTAGAVRLHPADLEALGQIIGRQIATAVGAGNYAAGRQIGLYTRGG